MYAVEVKAEEFAGKSMLQQHRAVQAVLKDEIEQMHGLTLRTSVPAGK